MPRATQNGIEYTDVLQYDGWNVGEAVTKNIVLKNMMFTAVRVTPALPKKANSAFSLKTKPQTVMISAGTTYSLPVLFKPTAAIDYDDALEISTPDGTVVVSLCARLPRPALTLPSKISFPLLAVGSTHTQSVSVTNTGAQPLTWVATIDGRFTVSPTSGELKSNETASLDVTFAPVDARTNQGVLRIKADGGLDNVDPIVYTASLTADSAFPFIVLEGVTSTPISGLVELYYGNMKLNQKSTRSIKLRNPTAVPAVVTVSQRWTGTHPACVWGSAQKGFSDTTNLPRTSRLSEVADSNSAGHLHNEGVSLTTFSTGGVQHTQHHTNHPIISNHHHRHHHHNHNQHVSFGPNRITTISNTPPIRLNTPSGATTATATTTASPLSALAASSSFSPSIKSTIAPQPSTQPNTETTPSSTSTTHGTEVVVTTLTVPPRGCVDVSISLKCEGVGVSEQFILATNGAGTTTLQCRATGSTPKVLLSKTILDFGVVKSGTPAYNEFVIENPTDNTIPFQIHSNSTVFSFTPHTAVATPRSVVTVKVQCLVSCDGFYSRNIILVPAGCPPVTLTCTAHTENAARVPLTMHENVVRPETGSDATTATAAPPPETISHAAPLKSNRSGTAAQHRVSEARIETRAGSGPITEIPKVEIKAEPRIPLVIDTTTVDFGQCAFGSRRKVDAIGGRQVAVCNNSESAVPVCWAVAAPFIVTPATATLEPRSTTTFTVSFQPLYGDISYASEAECFMSHTDGAQPTCFVVPVMGHTFAASPDVVLAMTPEVAMGYAVSGSAAWHYVHLVNETTVATQYSFSAEDQVTAYPPTGLIKAKSFLLCAVRLQSKATDVDEVKGMMSCMAGGARHTISVHGLFAAANLLAISTPLALLSSNQSQQRNSVSNGPAIAANASTIPTTTITAATATLTLSSHNAATGIAVSGSVGGGIGGGVGANIAAPAFTLSSDDAASQHSAAASLILSAPSSAHNRTTGTLPASNNNTATATASTPISANNNNNSNTSAILHATATPSNSTPLGNTPVPHSSLTNLGLSNSPNPSSATTATGAIVGPGGASPQPISLGANGKSIGTAMPASPIVFPPRMVNIPATCDSLLFNASPVPISYCITTSQMSDFSEQPHNIEVTPAEGVIMGGQLLPLVWTYTPTYEGILASTVTVTYTGVAAHPSSNAADGWSATGSGAVAIPQSSESLLDVLASIPEESIDILVKGVAAAGQLQVQEGAVDLGDVVVGRRSTSIVALCNPSIVSTCFALQHNGGPSVILTPSEGFIAARSRLNLVVAGAPQFEETIPFTISYTTFATSTTSTSTSTSTSTHPHTHAPTTFTPPSSSTWLPLVSGTLTGIRPRLAVVDAVCAGISRRQLQAMLNIDRLNQKVFAGDSDSGSGGVGDEEKEKEKEEELALARGSTGSESAMSNAVISFVPCVEGGSEYEVRMLLQNTGLCHADWAILLPTDLAYQPETWAKDSRPSARETQLKRILDTKQFTISPRKGALAPGATATLVWSYRPGVVGVDELPVKVAVGSASSSLVLRGETIASHIPRLHIALPTHALADIEVGTVEASVQHYVIRNVSNEDASVAISIAPLGPAGEPDFHELECGLSNVVVPAQGSAVLPFRFQPLSAGPHAFDVTLDVSECTDESSTDNDSGSSRPVLSTHTVRMTGLGVLHHALGVEPNAGTPILVCKNTSTLLVPPRLVVPGQLVTLSTELVDFGPVPAFGSAHRMVLLTNIAPQPVHFSWHMRRLSGVLAVTPAEGSLQPKETRVCIMVLKGTDGARVYDLDVLLQTYNESEHASYVAALAAATVDRERTQQGFTITDQGRTGRGRSGAYDQRPAVLVGTSARAVTMTSTEFPAKMLSAGFNPSLTASFSPAMQSDSLSNTASLGATIALLSATGSVMKKGRQGLAVTDLDLRTSKYQALPPITVPHSRTIATPRTPTPPQQQLVSITARIFPIGDMPCADLGASGGPCNIVDTSMAALNAITARTIMWASEAEENAVTEVLLQLVQSVLQECDMMTAISSLPSEPVPLFRQISDGPAAAPPPRELLALLDSILDNTLVNILAEAEAGECSLTARTVTR